MAGQACRVRELDIFHRPNQLDASYSYCNCLFEKKVPISDFFLTPVGVWVLSVYFSECGEMNATDKGGRENTPSDRSVAE